MEKSRQVFISYSHRDKVVARKIAKDLSTRDVPVWIDEWEIKIGESIVQKIDEGLKQSGYILALLSEHSIASHWVQKEVSLAYSTEIEGAQSIIIPVLVGKLSPSQIPIFLQSIRWIDLSTDYKSGIEDLIKFLSTSVSEEKPAVSPSDILNVSDFSKEIAKEVMNVLKGDIQGHGSNRTIEKHRDTAAIFRRTLTPLSVTIIGMLVPLANFIIMTNAVMAKTGFIIIGVFIFILSLMSMVIVSSILKRGSSRVAYLKDTLSRAYNEALEASSFNPTTRRD